MTQKFKKINSKNEIRYVLETTTAGATGSSSIASAPTSLGMLQKRLRELKDRIAEMSVDNAEYNDEAGMADNNLETLKRAVNGLDEIISAGDNLPEWCQEKIAVAKSMLVSVWDYMLSEKNKEMEGVSGGIAGGVIGAALTKTPSGAMTGYKIGSAAQDALSDKTNEGLRDPKDNPCWKGYRPVGTKKKNGKTVPNCVPKTNERIQTGNSQEKDMYFEYLSQKLSEKIPPGASVDYYIKDFAKSNAPQFRGKSQEKRRQMAIAAHYAAKQPKKTKSMR